MSIFSQYISFMLERQDQILELTTQHLYLTFIAVFFAVLVAVPLGITITRFEKAAGIVVGIANAVQALPSLALLGFLIPILGIGSKPSIVMIFLYSLLPIIKNTYTGLINVDRAILEAGRGMGMTNWQLMKMVQLPLALPVIMAGIRISAVTAVGLTTIAALVGAGGLGQLIYRGISMVNNRMIIAGAVPAMVLTLVIDFLLNILEKLVTPKGIRRKVKKVKR
ncbi:osmoprotectant transport system permease protein [Acetomicrobium thermoterrenum DSM 13490]|uniref:Osmoprotectant transport system permease protein n=1 Tax=Acetomicrobium thermoterrenum DSM 13490 TaxID=1120987 RepID=A0A1H3H7U8_9BACT|nr:ABC transporter permease [Acetomicrobium thermoterrenum]SDY11487.1 osmoprotectant transport system permease protein [Acetomicrobium thermoterrenum DSM 13490]